MKPKTFDDLSPIEQDEYVKKYGHPEGRCQKCGEEAMKHSDICASCLHDEIEYQKDVQTELGGKWSTFND